MRRAMSDIELLENMEKIIEMLCKNAAKSFGIDFAILNDTGVEVHRRLIELRTKLPDNFESHLTVVHPDDIK